MQTNYNKSTKLRHSSLLQQTTVKLDTDFTRAREKIRQEILAHSYVFPSLLAWLCWSLPSGSCASDTTLPFCPDFCCRSLPWLRGLSILYRWRICSLVCVMFAPAGKCDLFAWTYLRTSRMGMADLNPEFGGFAPSGFILSSCLVVDYLPLNDWTRLRLLFAPWSQLTMLLGLWLVCGPW